MKTSYTKVSVWLITLATLVALLLSVVPVATAQGGEFTLIVLHTNDVHGRVLQFNKYGSACGGEDAAEGKCFGGVARRATMINDIRDEGGNAIRIIGTDADITERKEAEQALQATNRALNVLSAGNEVVVHATSEERLLHDVCRIIVDIGGYHLAWVF